MARQSIDGVVQPNERWHARVLLGQTGLLDLRFQLESVWEIAIREEMRETVEDARRKIERFPNLASSTAATITDDVGRHGGAMFAVAAIDLLNHRFPAVATGQIQIDIGPAFAAFVQEPLENQIVRYRIDRSDAQAV